MWLSDQYKAAFQWRGDDPDPEPHFGLVFLVLLPLAAGIGSVAWLGWSWPALIVATAVTLLVGGLAVRKWLKSSKRALDEVPEWQR